MTKRVVLTRPAYTRPATTRKVVVGSRVSVRAFGDKSVRGEYGNPPKGVPIPPSQSPAIEAKLKKEVSVRSALDLANQLTKSQRKELLDQLALSNQLSSKANDDRDLDMWATAVQTALAEVVGSEVGGNYGVLIVKRLLGSTSCWRPVEGFMISSKLSDLRVVERQAIYFMLAKLLVDHASYIAKKSGAPLSPKLVGACVGSLPGVFEQNFPGYLAAGLAPLVAKQMQAANG